MTWPWLTPSRSGLDFRTALRRWATISIHLPTRVAVTGETLEIRRPMYILPTASRKHHSG